MNRNGKGGTIFIILIPIFIIVLAFLYDNILMMTNNKAYKEISYSIIKDAVSNGYNNPNDFIKDEYEKKKLETDQLKVIETEKGLIVYNIHVYPAFFGVILGTKIYRTEVDITAYLNDKNEVVIEENNGE